jgi:hypothetical protein
MQLSQQLQWNDVATELSVLNFYLIWLCCVFVCHIYQNVIEEFIPNLLSVSVCY